MTLLACPIRRLYRRRSLAFAAMTALWIANPGTEAADIVISTATTSQLTLGSTDNLTVTGPSAGSITVSSGSAVDVGTGVNSITNNGTITATSSTSPLGKGIQLQNGSSIANGVLNTGTISGYHMAIGVVTRGTNSGSTIDGGITNSGTLQINNPTGVDGSVITLSDVTLSGGINNSGSILHPGSSNSSAGIWLDALSVINGGITNSGTINSVGNAAIILSSVGGGATVNDGIKNLGTGVIESAIIPIRLLTDTRVNGGIENSGIIRGTSASAVGPVYAANNSAIFGGIDNKAGALMETTTSAGVAISFLGTSNLNGNLNNAGTITGGSGATGKGISVASTANIFSGGIVNSGTISSGGNALDLANTANPFSVSNTGTISGAAVLGINTLNLNGTTGRITGATTATGATGTVNVNGTFSSENTFNATTFNVNNGGTFVMNNNVTAGVGNFNNAGTLQVDAGKSVSLTGTFNNTGTARINGTLATSGINLSGGGTVAGSGTINGSVSGSGSIAPGSSAGILAATSVDPAGGVGFDFEFTGFDPAYGSATASVNDVLRLTGATPFASALNSSNNVRLYFAQAALADGEEFTGGFFTDTASDFTSSIADATFSYYIKGDGNGTSATYDGQGYYLLSDWQSDATLTVSTMAVAAPFFGGTINGNVMKLTVAVPEPSTILMGGIAASAFAFRAICRKKATRTN